MSTLNSNNSIISCMVNVTGENLNSDKNKKKLLSVYKNYVAYINAIYSVILVACMDSLIKQEIVTLIAVNGNNKYYKVNGTEFILAFVDNKAKLFNYDCVDILKEYKFKYDVLNGNFITKYEGITTCMEKIMSAQYLNVDIGQIRDKELHHKSLRCINCVQLLALLSKNEHDIGHKLVGQYARNQCIYIDSENSFKNFIDIVNKHMNELSAREFGLEF